MAQPWSTVPIMSQLVFDFAVGAALSFYSHLLTRGRDLSIMFTTACLVVAGCSAAPASSSPAPTPTNAPAVSEGPVASIDADGDGLCALVAAGTALSNSAGPLLTAVDLAGRREALVPIVDAADAWDAAYKAADIPEDLALGFKIQSRDVDFYVRVIVLSVVDGVGEDADVREALGVILGLRQDIQDRLFLWTFPDDVSALDCS